MRLASPEWLVLVPLLLAVGWMWRGLKLLRPLRIAVLIFLVLLLVRPEFRQLRDGLDLLVLVDRSASAADAMARQLSEWEALLERSRGAEDRLRFVDFAEFPVERESGTGSAIGSLDATRIRLAVQSALAWQDEDRATRLLLLSDGFATEPIGDLGELLSRQGIALDYRWTSASDAGDYGISDFRTPARVQPGEPFLITLQIAGQPDGSVPFELLRGESIIHNGTAVVTGGRADLRFTDRLGSGGAQEYRIRIAAPDDAVSGNNAAKSWTEVVAGPRVLLLTGYDADPLVGVLRRLGIDVDVVSDQANLDVGSLSGVRCVILNNVSASELPAEFLESLDFYVRMQAGGLLMVGGRQSFGSGGYFRSAIDELLPVSMELRSEHRKLAVAMAIVMDRSGSMAANVSPGVTKMDLANEGAARAIELLGASDAVSVLAVDSEPHVVVPLTAIPDRRDEIIDPVRRIQSGGGGIYVYNGLRAGWEELQKSEAGQRHIILFADAADAEQPDNYQKLLAEMQAGQATVSVIGLGGPQDPDAAFLEDVATRGGGRIFFNADAATLPALFEQETVAVARSAFLEGAVGIEPTAGWLELASRPLTWPESVDGYNLSYLRPEATAAAFSRDEYQSPLVAFWQRGAGRVAAVSFPLGGPFSGRARAWSDYGDFSQTLVRWLMGTDVPPGLGLQTTVDGSTLRLDLRFHDDWLERFARTAPEIFVESSDPDQAVTAIWERLQPGHFQARIELPPGQLARGAIRADEVTIPFGPVGIGLGAEWNFDSARRNELAAASVHSGGSERVDLSQIWSAPRPQAYGEIQISLLLAFLLTFLAEALISRILPR